MYYVFITTSYYEKFPLFNLYKFKQVYKYFLEIFLCLFVTIIKIELENFSVYEGNNEVLERRQKKNYRFDRFR